LLVESDSDLRPVKTSVDLALADACLGGKPVATSTNVEMASQLLGNNLHGSVSVASSVDAYSSAMPLMPLPLPSEAHRQ